MIFFGGGGRACATSTFHANQPFNPTPPVKSCVMYRLQEGTLPFGLPMPAPWLYNSVSLSRCKDETASRTTTKANIQVETCNRRASWTRNGYSVQFCRESSQTHHMMPISRRTLKVNAVPGAIV